MNTVVALCLISAVVSQINGFRTWRCHDNKCVKEETENFGESISINECKVKCLEYGGLWPKPTGYVHLGNQSYKIDISKIIFKSHEYPENIDTLVLQSQNDFLRKVKYAGDVPVNHDEVSVEIDLIIRDPSQDVFTTNADESYKVKVFPPESSNEISKIQVEIHAHTFFGLRHGLETLSQLFFYDDLHKVYQIINEVLIEDKPFFTHRGISLDTARSFIKVDEIIRLLEAMASNKLNTFHWHMTDSQSFPYESKAYPQLSERGAYSKEEIYTQDDIKKIANRAKSLGIRIIPELDAPAHVGEGWSALGEDLVTCFKWQPWTKYCVEPPCGQLNPTTERVYEILGTIYKEFVNLFNSDLIHLGGDEVNINCWKSTLAIQEWMRASNYSDDNENYINLWGKYQERALQELRAARSNPQPQAVLWTSTLTEPKYLGQYVRPEDYIIQIWTKKTDSEIRALLQNKFRVIFSNYDELYFDCGGPSWIGKAGQNWCSPYIGWQKVYNHSPQEILKFLGIEMTPENMALILGSESAIWTEQIDGNALHTRLWPRAAALAERLWSNPDQDWTAASLRMNHHRDRLARIVPVELVQPKWCYQNDGYCD